MTKIHAPSLEFPAKYKGRTGSSIRKLICHPSLWNNNNRTEIDFGWFLNIYQLHKVSHWYLKRKGKAQWRLPYIEQVDLTQYSWRWRRRQGRRLAPRGAGGEAHQQTPAGPAVGSSSVLFHRTRWPTHSPALWSAGWSGTGRCCRHGHTSQTELVSIHMNSSRITSPLMGYTIHCTHTSCTHVHQKTTNDSRSSVQHWMLNITILAWY